MLSDRYLETVADDVTQKYSEAEIEIICHMIERIMGIKDIGNYDTWKNSEIYLFAAYISQEMVALQSQTNEMIRKAIQDSVIKAVEADMAILKATLSLSDAMNSIIVDGVNSTFSEFAKLNDIITSSSNQQFINALDDAYLKSLAGRPYREIINEACTKLGKQGIDIIDFPKRQDKVEVAVRRALISSVNKTAGEAQLQNCKELNCNVVETTSHMGARPTHAIWQGKNFWVNEPVPGLENFKSATGYGQIDGLCGVNCYHSFMPNPNYPDTSAVQYDINRNNEQYELEQKQRYNERMIRYWKRRLEVKKTGETDSTKEQNKVREWQKKQRELIKANSSSLKRDYSREKIY